MDILNIQLTWASHYQVWVALANGEESWETSSLAQGRFA